MKNYYKKTNGELRMMIDTENNYVVRLYPNTTNKSINVVYTQETVDGFINEISDNTLWTVSTEVDFNNVKDQIISAI